MIGTSSSRASTFSEREISLTSWTRLSRVVPGHELQVVDDDQVEVRLLRLQAARLRA